MGNSCVYAGQCCATADAKRNDTDHRGQSRACIEQLNWTARVALACITFRFGIVCAQLTIHQTISETWLIGIAIVFHQRGVARWQHHRSHVCLQQDIGSCTSCDPIEVKSSLHCSWAIDCVTYLPLLCFPNRWSAVQPLATHHSIPFVNKPVEHCHRMELQHPVELERYRWPSFSNCIVDAEWFPVNEAILIQNFEIRRRN